MIPMSRRLFSSYPPVVSLKKKGVLVLVYYENSTGEYEIRWGRIFVELLQLSKRENIHSMILFANTFLYL